MLKHVSKYLFAKGFAGLLCLLCLLCFSACEPVNKEAVDGLNSISYGFHYKNLDSTEVYARRALSLAGGYGAGRAEAYNNLAFVCIMKMKYHEAYLLLDSVRHVTDNQVELLVADVQQMRLCQRESHNKDFYDYYENAMRTLRRIDEERNLLSPRLQRRRDYAESEFYVVASTYYYYVGLEEQSSETLRQINEDLVESDTAQYLNYLYQIGSGGILIDGTEEDIFQREWEHLIRCYRISSLSGDVFWQANALQGLSEHLFVKEARDSLIARNQVSMVMLGVADVPDSLIAGCLAERSLALFQQYGDAYQVASNYRTLASCYWNVGDYDSALGSLESALNENKDIMQAPNLIASIYERLSLVYSALDDKSNSDYYRNLYLDMQDLTRQDQQLEARAAQLSRASSQLNWMIGLVLVMILLTVLLLFLFNHMRRRNEIQNRQKDEQKIFRGNELILKELSEKAEETEEEMAMAVAHLKRNRRSNVDNRAKIFLVNSIMPLIDRMIHEINKLRKSHEEDSVRAERLAYIAEITDTINDYNQMLTEWIQLRQGELQLRIESFPMQEILDMVKRSRMSFQLKGINLVVNDSDAVVKADKILTLFMVNTIADNARKFTHEGGKVEITAQQAENYVEVSVTDTGEGMTEEQLGTLFTHQIQGGHGFGLLNCRGIIERYKKISKLFSVCTLQAESKVGEGSRLFFRLPLGIRKLVLLLLLSTATCGGLRAAPIDDAARYADSAYYSNVNGTYERTLQFADSVRHYLQLCARPDTSIMIGIANESAVAALALHQWEVYRRENREYVLLYKEWTADHSLGSYVSSMQRSSQNKNIAIFLLVILFFAVLVGYYMLYYRPRMRRQHIAEQRTVARSREVVEKRRREVEIMEDELHRAEYENQLLHVSNNVIDNCLSTLKHETMYYPSRIRHLLPDDGQAVDIEPIAELASYYKELYSLLSQQVMTQVEKPLADQDVEDYLFEILRRESGDNSLDLTQENDGEYVVYKVNMPKLAFRDFFKPVRENIPFLICRQIVRENSEATNRRGCGIEAESLENGTLFKIKIKKIKY